MDLTIDTHVYHVLIGSDLIRDGMYLEVSEAEGKSPLFEIFYSDVTSKMCVTTYRPDVALNVVEAAIEVAKKRLPPLKEA